MTIETSPFLKVVDIAFTIARLAVVFVLWNRFVPVWKYRKDDSDDRYFQKNEVAAVFVILAALGIVNAFITSNLPILYDRDVWRYRSVCFDTKQGMDN